MIPSYNHIICGGSTAIQMFQLDQHPWKNNNNNRLQSTLWPERNFYWAAAEIHSAGFHVRAILKV